MNIMNEDIDLDKITISAVLFIKKLVECID